MEDQEQRQSQNQSQNLGFESYVVIHNIAKRHNVGTLARSATAFGVTELILIGRRDFNSFGSHGSTSHVRFRHFYSLADARVFLKERNCDICGVEITDNAMAVNGHPFKKSTAFLLGNECFLDDIFILPLETRHTNMLESPFVFWEHGAIGLSAKECEVCDYFVYIPQYGCGTASLNVTVAASIILHHFAVWAGFPERTREGNKFVVAERPALKMGRNICTESAESVTEERKLKRENDAINGFFDESAETDSSHNLLGAVFGD